MEQLLPISLPPGVYRNSTEYGAKGRYYDCNLVRWLDGTLRPMRGWRVKDGTSTLLGAPRSQISWISNTGISWGAIGTHSHLYAMSRDGTITDITPARASGTLATDSFDTVDTDNTVTVNDTSHGCIVGDYVTIAAATDTGGLVLNGEWLVATVPGANSFTFEHTSAATSTVSGGGASATYVYAISPGIADSASLGGYGDLLYGDDEYGTPRPDTTATTPCSIWTLETYGQNLLAVRDDHGTVYDWQLNVSNRAAAVTNAPAAGSVVTTSEGFILALGAGSSDRQIDWNDQGASTVWTPSATAQAGSYNIESEGRLCCGARVHGGTLVLTTHDAHIVRYTGDNAVFNFNIIGTGCGAISRGALVSQGDIAIWMGDGQFWIYNGYVQPLPCDVEEWVFKDMNRLQRHKIHAVRNSEFNEIVWYFASDTDTNINRYVKYNTKYQTWDIGVMARTAACDRGAFEYPMACDVNGVIYEHEVGWSYTGGGDGPYAEGGPVELGSMGDNFFRALKLIPDEGTAGDVNATFYSKDYPNDTTEVTHGPYTLASPTDVRFQSRQFKVRWTTVVPGDWRVGVPRIAAIVGDRR